MYWRLGDKLAQMTSFLEPRPWPVAGGVHFDISTEADGMHLPRCGQVDDRGLGPAETGYSTVPESVTARSALLPLRGRQLGLRLPDGVCQTLPLPGLGQTLFGRCCSAHLQFPEQGAMVGCCRTFTFARSESNQREQIGGLAQFH